MTQAAIVIVDDHDSVRSSLRALLESADFTVKDYASAVAFLESGTEAYGDCLVVDMRMPKMTGLELQQELTRRKITIPLIIVTGHGDVPMAVAAMRAGAFDFLEKPFDDETLLDSIRRALVAPRQAPDIAAEARHASELISLLTVREGVQLEDEERTDFTHFDWTGLLAAEHIRPGD